MAKSAVVHVHKEEEFAKVLADAGDKAVVVDWFATWCGPCVGIAPYVEELASKFPSVVFVKVDVDELEGLTEKYDVRAMPTFLVFKRGARVGSLVGASNARLLALVTEHSK